LQGKHSDILCIEDPERRPRSARSLRCSPFTGRAEEFDANMGLC